MKKILLYSTGELLREPQTGGTKRFLELARYLCKHENAYVCSRDSSETLMEKGLNPYARMSATTMRWARYLPAEFGLFFTNRKLLKRVRKENFDKVIVFDVPPATGLCSKRIKHIVLMVRKDLIGYEHAINHGSLIARGFKTLFLIACESYCFNRAETIIVQCNYDKEEILKRHRIIRKKIEKSIHCQINNTNPSWIVEKSNVTETNENKTGFTIGFVGNFSDGRKGHDILLEAAKRIVERHPWVYFWIIGGGKELEKYKCLYSSSNIKFFGYQDNPLRYIKKCDLVVVPSKADSCPNTVLEALYNSIVVIGSRAGGIPELLEDDGALFDISADSLYKLIKTLLHDPNLITKLQRKQSLRKKELCFDWAERIEQIL